MCYNRIMLLYNKYLKELGYKKKDFPFDLTGKEDSRYALDKECGVVEAQTWNVETTIVLELYTYIRFFQDNFMKCATPAPYFTYEDGDKKWHQVVADIVDGLRAYIDVRSLNLSDFKDLDEYKKVQQEYFDKFDKGWKLLGENIQCFWW